MLVLVSVSMVLGITRANRVCPNYPLVTVIVSANDLTLKLTVRFSFVTVCFPTAPLVLQSSQETVRHSLSSSCRHF